MKLGLLILVASLLVGTITYMLRPTRAVYVDAPDALTYDLPLRVLTKAVRAGEPFTTQSTRCNNTGADLAVEITIWWQDAEGHLTPYIVNGTGPRFTGIVIPAEPACRYNYTSTNPFPAGIPPNIYTLRGRVCYGIESMTCTGWNSEEFTVLP